jgi:hypothetical protein
MPFIFSVFTRNGRLPAFGEKPMLMRHLFLLIAGTLATSYLWTQEEPLPVDLDAPPIPQWLVAEWEGTGYQTNTDTQWLTLLTKSPGDLPPMVEYPTLDCRGYWEYAGETDGRLTFREIITENSGRCANNDYIYITQKGRWQILVEYAHSWAPRRIIASALLDQRMKP